MRSDVADAALIERQCALQREASELMRELEIAETLARMGAVLGVGSAFTGLMVWRDVDLVVDAGQTSAAAAFEAVLPLLGRSRAVRYERQSDPRRHYFVLRIPWRGECEWKLDISAFLGGVPPHVEAFHNELLARLDDEIYDAVLHHGAETLADLDRYLSARDMPTLAD
jgi:hypothetical protein